MVDPTKYANEFNNFKLETSNLELFPVIHKTAIIHRNANVPEDSEIGPYCVIGSGVSLGSGCTLHSHVVIEGHTQIGKENEFFPFCSIGQKSQDLKYKSE